MYHMRTSTKDISLLQCSGKTWSNFLEECNESTIFHSIKYLQIIRETVGGELIFYCIQEENGNLIGGIPILRKKLFGVTVLTSPPPGCETPYGGPLVKGDYLKELLHFVVKLEDNFIFYSTTSPFSKFTEKQFPSKVLVYPKKTFILNLGKPLDILWSHLEKRARNAVRRFNKYKLEVEDNSKDIKSFYKLLASEYRRAGIRPMPFSFYRKLFKSYHPHGLRLMIAWHRDSIAAGLILLMDKERMYYLNGVANRKFLYTAAMSGLQWSAIKLGRELGVRVYDLAGANVKNIAKFKRQWSDRELPYYSFAYGSNPLFILALRWITASRKLKAFTRDLLR